MKAVFKHELASCFTGLTGYIFGAFLLIFAGIYTLGYHFNSMITNFEYVVASMAIVYIIGIPVLTMRLLAEERRQKTDQLLYALPLTMTKVVLGKFFAMLVMLALPVAIIGVYPLILSAFGNIYLPQSYSALVAFFLLGASLIAVGMYISSVTESQAVAAGLCFVIMLLNYFLGDLVGFVGTTAFASFAALAVLALPAALAVRLMTKSGFAALLTAVILEVILVGLYLVKASVFEGLISAIMEKLSLFERFYVFVEGTFDVTGMVYFLSVTGVFLFLCVQSMEKRRWSE